MEAPGHAPSLSAATANASGPRPTRRARRWILAAILLAGLVALAFFTLTNPTFLKRVVLPRLARSLGVQATVSALQLHPFSEIRLQDLRIVSMAGTPILRAESLRIRFSLPSLLRGTPEIREVSLEAPVLNVVLHPDGTTNLDPPPTTAPEKIPARTRPSTSTPRLQLQNISLRNGRVTFLRQRPGGDSETYELSELSLSLDRLANGQPGHLRTETLLSVQRSIAGVSEQMTARGRADLNFDLGVDLLPRGARGTGAQEILEATGNLAPLVGLHSDLKLDLKSNLLETLTLDFSRSSTNLGTCTLAGPIDLPKAEARLQGRLGPLGHDVLDLLGAPFGLKFTTSRVEALIDLAIANGGSTLTLNTRIRATPLAVAHLGRSLPGIDLALGLNGSANLAAQSGRVTLLTFEAQRNGRPFAAAELAQPTGFNWARGPRFSNPTQFKATVTNLNLAEWHPLMGELKPEGTVDAALQLTVPPDLGSLDFSLSARTRDLRAAPGPSRAPLLQAAAELTGQLRQPNSLSLRETRIELRTAHSPLPLLTLTGTAQADLEHRTLKADLAAASALPAAQDWLPAEATVTGGTLQTTVRASLGWPAPHAPDTAWPEGAFALTLRLEDLDARLKGRDLVSFDAGADLDLAFTNGTVLVRESHLVIPRTSRVPHNGLTLSGSMNLKPRETISGSLLAASEALDLTPFAALTNRAAAPSLPASPDPSPREIEPEPFTLPLRQFTAQLKIDRVLYQNLVVSNCSALVVLETNRIQLRPFQVTLHGTPLRAEGTLTTTVPGYEYSGSIFTRNLPLQPLIDAFAPDYRGRMKGELLLDAKFKGRGITSPNVTSNLTAQFSLSLTNAQLDLLSPRAKSLVTPIATALGAGDVANSPIDWIVLNASLGGQRAQLGRTEIQSSAFHAALAGTIPLAHPIARSPLNLPVQFALRRSLANSLSLLPANDPSTNTSAYVPLPAFVTVKGTLGEPRSEVNRAALGSLVFRSGVGIADKMGVLGNSPAGQILRGISAILGGASTGAPGTNSPPTLPSKSLPPASKGADPRPAPGP